MNDNQELPKTPESIIESVKKRLQDLALEISDNESRLDLQRSQVLELERTRSALIMEYQKTLHAVIAMSELNRFNVESVKEAQEKKTPKASMPPFDFSQEEIDASSKSRKVNK